MDILLSSGFLAFARHIGFLDALTRTAIQPKAFVGTSSGAMVAALHVAGHDLDTIAEELSGKSPLSMLSWSLKPWSGLFSTRRVETRLRGLLPRRIEDLPLPFAVGVKNEAGQHELLTTGDLPSAVMASCAMPVLFRPVGVDGRACQDGGAIDRLGIDAWRVWRSNRPGIAHWVERTAGKDIDTNLDGITVVRTPKSGARLWSLGDFDQQRREASTITSEVIDHSTLPTD